MDLREFLLNMTRPESSEFSEELRLGDAKEAILVVDLDAGCPLFLPEYEDGQLGPPLQLVIHPKWVQPAILVPIVSIGCRVVLGLDPKLRKPRIWWPESLP